MGKTGKLIRKNKKQTSKYTFTGEQLEERDKAVIAEYRKTLDARMMESARNAARIYENEAEEHIQDYWDSIEKEFNTGDRQEDYNNLLSYLLSISSRVLIERFHWKPIPKDGNYDGRNRTYRFAQYVMQELAAISEDDEMDVRRYSAETFEKYGVKYVNKADGAGDEKTVQ